MKCLECDKEAVWVRKTQFAGDHPFCDVHARKEKDWGDDEVLWERCMQAHDGGYSIRGRAAQRNNHEVSWDLSWQCFPGVAILAPGGWIADHAGVTTGLKASSMTFPGKLRITEATNLIHIALGAETTARVAGHFGWLSSIVIPTLQQFVITTPVGTEIGYEFWTPK